MRNFPSFLLFRSYIAIVLGIVLVALALDSLLVWWGADRPDSENKLGHPANFLLIEEILTEGGQTHVESTLHEKTRRIENLLGVPFTLFEESDFAGLTEPDNPLNSGAVISATDSEGAKVFYRRLTGSDYILALGPVPSEEGTRNQPELAIMTSYYLIVAFIIFLWIRPFYRDLSALRHAAGQLGKDDFSTRITLPKSSGILPVAQSFNNMAERIQHLVSAHRELTSAVSHELRTPLARFKFSLEMLSRDTQRERIPAYLASMRQDVQELEILTDEMLGYAKLSEQNLLLKPGKIRLRQWLQNIVDQYRDEEIPIEYSFRLLHIGGHALAVFDADLMARAVHNVLRNCLRYAHSSVTLSAHLSQAATEIRICDDGPGIPEDMREKIFEPFSRLDTSRDRQSGGHGLGLAIACRILQRHGGSITVEERHPSGSCFILRWSNELLPQAADSVPEATGTRLNS